MSRKNLIIGGAGFIGSHLADLLLLRGERVTVFDNLSNGQRGFLEPALAEGKLELIVADALESDAVCRAMADHQRVFHLSANPEARHGLTDTAFDLHQGTMATHQVLEAMRLSGTRELVFASSGTVYGEREEPAAESDLGQLPISLYGASKLAGEAMISAFSSCFGLEASIVRFGNVVGSRGTHGVILDFLRKLKRAPDELEVLGDGQQRKPYLHVSDCVAGLLFISETRRAPLEVFNLCPPDTTSVRQIAEACVACSPNPSARIRTTGGDRGWPGDVPRSRMRPESLRARGFATRLSSDEAVALAVQELSREVFGEAASC